MIPGTTTSFAETNGVRLEVTEAGAGPLVILLHGFPELAYSWRHQFAPLVEAGFRVVAPNQRGYGKSSRPDPIESYSLENLAQDVAGLIRHFAQEPAVVLGHDWGRRLHGTQHCASPSLSGRLVH